MLLSGARRSRGSQDAPAVPGSPSARRPLRLRRRGPPWRASALAGALVASLGLAVWLQPTEREARPAPVPAVAPPQAPAPPAPRAAEPAVPAAPEAATAAHREALLESDAALRERARQQQLAAAADARWHEAVDARGYRAQDLDPAIRALFRAVRLEPRYAEDGGIDGLTIAEWLDDNALRRAGFEAGDRLTRIQGVALRDPAELPSLLARLGPHVEFCAERGSAERCREVALD